MTSDLALPADLAPAPTTLFASDDPAVIVQRATRIANAIAPLIRERHLFKRIGKSEHVYVEAWALAGSMLGVFAITVRTWEIGDDDGYGATVEARTITGAIVGRADAVVMRGEAVGTDDHGDPIRKWLEAPAFQLISMAQTRGSSKALRMPLAFIMKLAGYETTPAEEMEAAAARGETVSGGKGVADGWRDIGEQIAAHKRMDAYVTEHGLGDWVAVFIESKGYGRPLSKPQMADLRRALDREIEQLSEQSGAGSSDRADVPGDDASARSPVPDPVSPSSATSPAGGGGHQSPPARSDLGRETHAGGGPKSPPTPNAREHSPMEADRVGVEGAQPDASEPDVGSPHSPDVTAPPEQAAEAPPRQPSGGTKGTGP